jgi:hypothetical protein
MKENVACLSDNLLIMFWFFVVLWSIIVLSFLKDLLAWLQIFQHKEYRWAKYKEYLFSIQ